VSFDLSSALTALASGTYVVTRRAASSFSQGRAVAATSETLNVAGSLQPVSGLELQRLAEGIRNRETKAFFTTTLLRTAEPNGHEADVMDIGTAQFEVVQVKPWEFGGYYKVILARVS
jgi:hypothetical protein